MRKCPRPGVRRLHLFLECLEDRTTPAGLVDAFASTVSVVDAPVERINVVSGSGTETAALAAELAASPYASAVQHVGFGIYNVTLTSGIEAGAAAAYYSTLPGVSAAEPDYVIQVRQTPNDTFYSQLYGMAQINAPAAWDASTGSGDFVVAVIDTGVDYNHPDLAANIWHNPNETPGDGVDNDGNGIVDDYYGANFVGTNSGDPYDDYGHGTHVAGTIGAAGNNALGVAGVNWNVKIMALKFISASGSGTTSDAIEALNYAVAHGVKVSNNSWGGGGYSTALFNAIQSAQHAGHIFVAAAGNSNVNIDGSPSYPASYNLANVVAVASTTGADAKSSFSNYGTTTVDIAAPGSDILSTTPNNTYSYYSGTSMATPHVTGAIALYWDSHPTATASEVIAKLTGSADAVPELSSYVNGGRRLNVGRMMESTSPPPPPPSPPADNTGARVTAAAFSGSSSSNLATVRFTFNEAINPTSFTTADVASFSGPGGPIAASGVAVVPGSGNTQIDVSFPTQTTAGAYAMTIGPAILDAAGNPMDQNANGANGEATGDQYTATRNFSPASTQTFTGAGLPLPIRDLAYTRATISVGSSMTISDVNVKFSATHSFDHDLVIRLIGPGGQVSTLVNRRGGSKDNFTSTTLDDEAETSISAGSAPFTGTYRPETSLAVFDNLNAAGTWTLEIYDATSRDTGSLTAFALIITGANGGSQFMTAFGVKEGASFTEPVKVPRAAMSQNPVALAAPVEGPAILAPIALPPATAPLPVRPVQQGFFVGAYLPPESDTVDVWDNPLLT